MKIFNMLAICAFSLAASSIALAGPYGFGPCFKNEVDMPAHMALNIQTRHLNINDGVKFRTVTPNAIACEIGQGNDGVKMEELFTVNHDDIREYYTQYHIPAACKTVQGHETLTIKGKYNPATHQIDDIECKTSA